MMRTKRWIGMLLCAAVVLTLLPKAALAELPTRVMVGDVDVTSGYTTAKALPAGSGMSGTVTYVPTSTSGATWGELTLDNVTVPNTKSHNRAAVYVNGTITIVLKGTNVLTGPDDESSYGIMAYNSDNLTIQSYDGTAASLTATGGAATSQLSIGIQAMNAITIPAKAHDGVSENAAVITGVGGTVYGNGTNNNSIGIRVQAGNSILGGAVIAKGNTYGMQCINSRPSLGTGWYQWRRNASDDFTKSTDQALDLNQREAYLEIMPLSYLYFRTQPTDQTVDAGETATFAVAAAGGSTPGYQWQVSKDGGASWRAVAGGTGGTTDGYTTAAAAADMNGYLYRCVVSGNPSQSLVSNAAKLTVVNVPKTGDSSMPGLWLGLLLLAMAGLSISAAAHRRKEMQ